MASILTHFRTGTWQLLHVLNTLIRLGVAPAWLSVPVMRALTLIPLRPDGVRCSLEFIFTVHPTTAQSEQSQGQGTGRAPAVTPEAIKMASQVICSPPQSMSPESWFLALRPQIYAMLDGEEGPGMKGIISHVLCSGLLAKKRFGAPGLYLDFIEM